MESSNPVLQSKVFEQARIGVGQQSMTVQGTVNKTLILLAVLLATAVWSWSLAGNPSAAGMTPVALMASAIGGLVLALATSFKPQWAPVTAPLYAAFEGVFLGIVSVYFEMRYPGLVMQAVAITFGVLFCMLSLYKSGIIKVTNQFILGVAAATGAIALLYIVSMVLSVFHINMPFLYASGPLGIGFSIFVAGLAAFNLVIDFHTIEEGSRQGAHKYMEWYGAFALMVTLIWLYFEILRLLGKLRERK